MSRQARIVASRMPGVAAVRAALAGARRVVVLEKALAVGIGGIVSADV